MSSTSDRAPGAPRICLNMIVRDEAAVIERCLRSVRPHVDSWLIVDTGSVDDTRERVRAVMEGLPGEVVDRPWRNFGHNRTEALELARGRGDYLLFIDADETLGTVPGFRWPALTEEAYSLEARYGAMSYDRVLLVATRVAWRWTGVLHEYLDCGRVVPQPRLPGIWVDVRAEGARSRDPKKFEKDAAMLEEALAREPGNARYVFYLAQSHRDAGNVAKARAAYERRAAMGGWPEEAWYARYEVARCAERLGDPPAAVVRAYLEAYEARPTRAEPLVNLARYLRLRGEMHSARLFAAAAVALPSPADRLFVDVAAHGWMAVDELALAHFYSGGKPEAAKLWRGLLEGDRLPAAERPRIEANLGYTAA
jgi:tetratricopeptide (TPR) repeat protein